MDLEQRVQALEQEVEILKNQIQATLLDIQEQILTNAHPTLRSDHTPAPGASQPAGPENSAPIKSFKSSISEDGEEKSEGGLAHVRKVSFDTFQVTAAEEEPAAFVSPPAPSAAANPVSRRNQPVNWSTVDEMEDWVCGKVEKIGAARTRQLIEMYRESGRFDEDVTDTLLQYVEVYSGEADLPFEFDERRRTGPPAWPQAKQVTANPESVMPEPPIPQTVARVPAAESVSAKSRRSAPPAAASVPSPKMNESRPQTIKPQPEMADPAQLDLLKDDPAAESDERSTILRLIAGVYNAGAGVKWGKKDG